MFSYCLNNPVNGYDPAGTAPLATAYTDDPFMYFFTIYGGGGGGGGGGLDVAGALKHYTSLNSDLKKLKKFVNNESEEATFEYLRKYGFAFYKGVPVFLANIGEHGGGFSYGVIVLDDAYLTRSDRIDVLKHEYGHKVHMDQIGVVKYTTMVAIPSLTGAGLDYMGWLPVDYCEQPWERIADQLGGVTGEYEPWADTAGSLYWLYTLIMS